MSGDFPRWLENETAAALTHDKPGDPFDRIPDTSGEYEGTVLETPQERAARAAEPHPEEETGR